MDKTKRRVRKIVLMAKRLRDEVVRAACVCALLVSASPLVALADPGKSKEPPSTGLGYGGAYLFGLAAGLAMFGVRYALDVRKAHLAAYGK